MHPDSKPRKYFRSIVKIEVLSEGEPWDGDLESLHDDIIEGSCSGMQLPTEITELTEAEAAEALENQGSDPDFLIQSGEWFYPLRSGDEVTFKGEEWLVVESPDPVGDGPSQATSNDVIRLRRGDAWETTEVFRHELS